MEEDTLIPFLVVTDNDEYQKEYFGFRCACHGWAVRESAVITKKKPFSLAGTSPRAIILDLRFAGLLGTEFLARLRSDRSTQVPIVMLAAEDILAAEMSALEEWDVEVLPKEAGAPQAAAALISEALTA